MHESAAIAEPRQATRPSRRARSTRKHKRQPPFHVILWNDDDHSYAYVVVMLLELFGYPPEKGYLMAKEVDAQGRAVVLTTTKEHAELKRDQIHAYGKDGLITECKGSMWCTIEASQG